MKGKLSGNLKLSSTVARLNKDYGFGLIQGSYLHFNDNDRNVLIKRVQDENGVHLFREPYPEEKSRLQSASTNRNEKHRSYAVSRDFILINSFTNLKLNQTRQTLNPLTSLGVFLKADEITSVEHKQIILVENLAIMGNIKSLIIPSVLKDALWVYRGDLKEQQSTSTAYQFFRRFSDRNELICFSDLDPKGIEIAISSGAHYWLTPKQSDVINMKLDGIEQEWFKQGKAIKYLQSQRLLPQKCQEAFIAMAPSQKTLKQEHMLTHSIELDTYQL